jgi:hypothetical protein
VTNAQPATWPAYGASVCRSIIRDMPHLPITVHYGQGSVSTRYVGNRTIRLTPTLTEVTAQQWERRAHGAWWPTGPLLRAPYPSIDGIGSTAFPAAVRTAVETLAVDLDTRRAAA